MSDSRLDLYQILEGEYEVLHGKTPPQYKKFRDELLANDDRLIANGENAEEARAKTNEKLVRELNKLVHSLPDGQRRAALCISGGGIRSATFALGVIQKLAALKLLDKFHYLSTVSGGGYIGSWLTSWIHNEGNDPQKVAEKLDPANASSPLKPEPEPIHHLRDYSRYLSPRLGLLSADTWTLVAVYIRNLLLNWLVLLPLLTSVLMIPRFYAYTVRCIDAENWAPLEWHMLLLLGGAIALGGIAIGYIGLNRPSTSRKNNSQKKFLWCCLAPLVVSAVLVTIYWGGLASDVVVPIWIFLAFGSVVTLLGFVFRIATSLTSGKKPGEKGGEDEQRDKQKDGGVRWFWDFVASLISGAVGGGLLYLVASAPFLIVNGGRGEAANLPNFVCFALPLVLASFLISGMLYVGFISFITSDDDREWFSRSDAWILIVIIMWAAVCVLVIYGPIAFHTIVSRKALAWIYYSIGGVSGLITLFAGHSSQTPSNGKPNDPGLFSKIMSKALVLAGPLFIVFTLTMLTLAANGLLGLFPDAYLTTTNPEQAWRHLTVVFGAPIWEDALVAGGLFSLSALMALVVNINRFSLHAMYRNRLIRAYLGASNLNSQPNKFTGFDSADNMDMYKLWPANPDPKRNSLLHVVNMALNLVSGDNLAWQDRKAESFTVTALHSGSARLGYRVSKEYGKGISLGTAMAISGAAASPNMGYHSSKVLAFIMTLFNLRLGWWLGNPGDAGERTYKKPGPFWAIKPLIAEVFGLTTDRHKYVYLSDGGHFENLGLYEMVRRRCHLIVVSDGGQDQECAFQDLGAAIRKIRIDFGIPIDFTHGIPIFMRSADERSNLEGRYCAVGTIKYSNVDGGGAPPGVLIYIKPAFYGRGGIAKGEPRDVYQYALSSLLFPHESTGDQFFSESQFESYRALGSHSVELICGTPFNVASLAEFAKKAQEHMSS